MLKGIEESVTPAPLSSLLEISYDAIFLLYTQRPEPSRGPYLLASA